MKNKILRVFLALAFILSLEASLAGLTVSAEERCQTILYTKCTGCHYLTRVCQVLGKKNKRAWKRSIKNMVRYGTRISREEQKILVDCLSNAPPRDKKVCK